LTELKKNMTGIDKKVWPEDKTQFEGIDNKAWMI
jgi:hypothetical protein